MVVNVIRLRFNSTNSLGILQFVSIKYLRDPWNPYVIVIRVIAWTVGPLSSSLFQSPFIISVCCLHLEANKEN